MSYIDVVVIRGAGDKPGDTIVEPILGSEQAAIARGKKEINDAADSQPINLETAFRMGVRNGQLAQIMDSAQGAAYKGKIRSIRHVADGDKLTTQLVIDRPGRFNE